MRVELGRSFGWVWSAYAVSTYGTSIAFGAFPLIVVQVLHSPAFAVSLLEAAGLTVAAIVAVPLGPWVEHRAKRPVMIASDLARFLAMASVPIAYFLGSLTYGQLLVVSVVSGTCGSDVAAPRDVATGLRATDLLGGWRFIRHDRVLRRLFLNSILVSGLIMATLPLLAVLLLGEYHLPAWQYGLAFGIPALGGFVGARLSARLVASHGRYRVMIVSGWLPTRTHMPEPAAAASADEVRAA